MKEEGSASDKVGPIQVTVTQIESSFRGTVQSKDSLTGSSARNGSQNGSFLNTGQTFGKKAQEENE